MRRSAALFVLVGLVVLVCLTVPPISPAIGQDGKTGSPSAIEAEAAPRTDQAVIPLEPSTPVPTGDAAARKSEQRRPKLPRTWQGTFEDDLTPAQRFAHRLLSTVSYVWIFALGACIGSFSNVVVYRSPRGMSVFWPPSRCSVCGQRVRPRDNIPIVSWLVLRGRCRFCATPFSIRYMLVELTFGLVFFALGWRELLSGGANLPVRPVNAYTGPAWILWHPKWDLILISLFHVQLMCHLLVAALIHWDGLRVSAWQHRGALLLAWLMPACFPFLHVVPLSGHATASSRFTWNQTVSPPLWWTDWFGGGPVFLTFSFDELLTGLVGSVVCGGLIWCLSKVAGHSAEGASEFGLLGMAIGGVLGWQGGLLVGLSGCLLMAGGSVVARLGNWTGSTRAAGFAWGSAVFVTLMFWEPLSAVAYLPGATGDLISVTVTLVAAFCLAAVSRVAPVPVVTEHSVSDHAAEARTADRQTAGGDAVAEHSDTEHTVEPAPTASNESFPSPVVNESESPE